MHLPLLINARVLGLAMTSVLAAAVLLAARQPSQRADIPAVDPQPAPVATAARLNTKKTVASKPRPAAAVDRARAADTTVEKAPATTLAVKATATAPVESAKMPAADSKAKANAAASPSVTITGCLALDKETFWLTDTSGADAPKSRSWKSGFLRRRSAPIELVDTANTLKLTRHVGERVAATGVLTNREMRARSLQRVAGSCS